MDVISCTQAKERGLKHYFTGVPCKRGHIERRDVSHRRCMKCAVIEVTEYIKRNAEKVKQRQKLQKTRDKDRIAKVSKAYRAAHPNEVRARRRSWYERNRAKILAELKIQRQDEKEKLSARRKEQRARHKEKTKIYMAKWRAENRDRRREYDKINHEKRRLVSGNRRAFKRGLAGKTTNADLSDLKRLQKNKCAYCRVLLSKRVYHIDHITPLARGGSNLRSNLQLLCQPCNQSKHAKDPIVFAQQLGMLL